MPKSPEISSEVFERLMHESIGHADLVNDRLVDKSSILSIKPTIPTTYTFSFPPGCA